MNRETLETLSPEELLKLIEDQVRSARSTFFLADDFRFRGIPGCQDEPLVTVGDFEIWPRFER